MVLGLRQLNLSAVSYIILRSSCCRRFNTFEYKFILIHNIDVIFNLEALKHFEIEGERIQFGQYHILIVRFAQKKLKLIATIHFLK